MTMTVAMAFYGNDCFAEDLINAVHDNKVTYIAMIANDEDALALLTDEDKNTLIRAAHGAESILTAAAVQCKDERIKDEINYIESLI